MEAVAGLAAPAAGWLPSSTGASSIGGGRSLRERTNVAQKRLSCSFGTVLMSPQKGRARSQTRAGLRELVGLFYPELGSRFGLGAFPLPRRALRVARRLSPEQNSVVNMARDDPVAKRAKDQQNIEDFMPDLDELDKDELQGFLELELESSLDLETMKHYEIMFLIHEKYAVEVQAVIKKVQDFIAENKGIIYRLNDWGMRSLAYDIKKASRANYVLMNIKINSQAINVLNSLFEKDERVIRHMVMSQKVGITEDSLPPEEYRPSRVAEEEEEEEEEEYEDEDEGEDQEQEEIELVLQRE